VRVVVSAGAVLVAAAAGLRGLPRALWRTLPGVLFGSAAVVVVLVCLVRVAQVLFFLDVGGAASSLLNTLLVGVYFVALTAQLVSLTLFVPQRLYEREQAMKARLDLLYRELNHRVGNDLNVIYNTMDLARANLDDDAPSRAVLAQSQNLVGTITAMHRALKPERDGTSGGALDDYLAMLARQALDSFRLPHVRLETDMDAVRADAKTLKNCGLIVNELVTNACKYAFAGRAEGAVTLRLARTALPPKPGAPPRQRLQVTVADDGAGLAAPWGEGAAQGTGLGRALVDGLLRDLDATLDVATRPAADGTRFTWTFEANDPAADPAPADAGGSDSSFLDLVPGARRLMERG
jgi:two-component sensor histidine kinase